MEDKADVVDELLPAQAKCDAIAEALRVQDGKIQAARIDHETSCESRLREYVDEWLKGNAKCDPTWASLCKALKRPSVGRPDVADKIAAKHMQL